MFLIYKKKIVYGEKISSDSENLIALILMNTVKHVYSGHAAKPTPG